MKFEEFKDVPGFPYRVSSLGRVWSRGRNGRRGLYLKPRKSPGGGYAVVLHSSEEVRQEYVHRLVAEAFLERPDGCDCVVHLNGDLRDNRAENLEWTTKREASLRANEARWGKK